MAPKSGWTPRTDSEVDPTPREDQACLSKRRVQKVGLQSIGRGLDRLVDQRQLLDFPRSTLCCARVVKVSLWFIVISSTLLMVSEYFLGTFGVAHELIKVTDFEIPNMVVCPVWGQTGMKFEVLSATTGNLALHPYEKWKPIQYHAEKCHKGFEFEYVELHHEKVTVAKMENGDLEKLGCYCIDLFNIPLQEDPVGKEGIRIAFTSLFEHDGGTPIVSVGFGHGELYPTEWAYVETGKRNIGDLFLETRTYGATAVTTGESIDTFSLVSKVAFPVPDQPHPSRVTELVFMPGNFFVKEISDVGSIWSLFALVSFLVLVMANLNSIQLFDICFSDKVDAEDPAQLEPNWCLRKTFWCCDCMHQLPEPKDDDL